VRAAVIVIGLALPLCPGCFTILGAAVAAAGGGPNALASGAQLDADIARGVTQAATTSGGTATVPDPSDPGLSVAMMGDPYLCTVPGGEGGGAEAEVIEAHSLAGALDVCAAFNDLGDDGACVCHAIRELPAAHG
jgi:hypothetical protein